MRRRDEWRKVLDAETGRWSAKSCEQLIAELHEVQAYEVVVDSKSYQVEVEIIENTQENIHVALGVDDGSLPWSINPESRTFIRKKKESN
jgi:hypothetical protein